MNMRMRNPHRGAETREQGQWHTEPRSCLHPSCFLFFSLFFLHGHLGEMLKQCILGCLLASGNQVAGIKRTLERKSVDVCAWVAIAGLTLSHKNSIMNCMKSFDMEVLIDVVYLINALRKLNVPRLLSCSRRLEPKRSPAWNSSFL